MASYIIVSIVSGILLVVVNDFQGDSADFALHEPCRFGSDARKWNALWACFARLKSFNQSEPYKLNLL